MIYFKPEEKISPDKIVSSSTENIQNRIEDIQDFLNKYIRYVKLMPPKVKELWLEVYSELLYLENEIARR